MVDRDAVDLRASGRVRRVIGRGVPRLASAFRPPRGPGSAVCACLRWSVRVSWSSGIARCRPMLNGAWFSSQATRWMRVAWSEAVMRAACPS